MRRMHAKMLSQQTLGELVDQLSEESIIKAGQNAGRTAPEEVNDRHQREDYCKSM